MKLVEAYGSKNAYLKQWSKNVNRAKLYFLIFVSICCYLGHGFVENFDHKNKTENTANNIENQYFLIAEPSFEGDHSYIFPSNYCQITNSEHESILLTKCLFSSNLYFPIWLPPDLS